jgi:eukaryotic-like serine/threonine-protein kinase
MARSGAARSALMTDTLREHLQQTLGASYALERELGGGGMSRVFVATDAGLNRQVVVKVLPSESPGQLSNDRFRREIAIAARLQHPHIVPLLAAGEVDALPWFTMPFVAGESLRVRLARDGELPIPEAVRILREVASALAYAHANGVVHRDIKPDNVLLSGGAAMVTDFGVAKALAASQRPEHGDARDLSGGITSVGMALGTPAYMAPEQASGDPQTDHRADIYAWGILAYEVLTGQAPFAGRTPQAMIAAQVAERPEDIRRRRPAVPAPLADLVMRCLEKRPADRPQTADELVRTLDQVPTSGASAPLVSAPRRTGRGIGLLAVVVVVVVAAAGWLLLRGRGGNAVAPSGPVSLAVLPIENVGGDSAKEYLADGMTTEMASTLRQSLGLDVVGDLSTFRFKHTTLPPDQIARELHVGMLLTGRMQSDGGRIRLQMQLNDATGKLLWSRQYDRQSKDDFALEDSITSAVAGELRLVLHPAAVVVAQAGRTENAAAHDLYLRGMFEKNKLSDQSLNRAVDLFQQALKLDPDYAQAAAAMGFAYDMLADAYRPSHPYHQLAMAAARRALASDSMLAEAHVLYGFELGAANWDVPAGIAEMRKGLALNPNSPDGLFMYSSYLGINGETDSAVAAADRLIKVDPLSPMASMCRAADLVFGGRFAEGLHQDSITKSLDANVIYGDAWDGFALREMDNLNESVQAYRRFEAVYGQPAFGLAMTWARLGRRDSALAIIHQLEADAKKKWVDPVFTAAAYAALGDRDHAMQWLQNAYDVKDWVLRFSLNYDNRWFRPLDGDPRFERLRQKVRSTIWSDQT